MTKAEGKVRRLAPFALAAFCALVWLNQGATGEEYERLYEDVHARPLEDIPRTLQFPFRFLYRRASDEELYFVTASAILGLPRDESIVSIQRGAQPERFATLPPADGRFHMPYAEVLVEYPAPVLPFVVGPRLVTASFAGYARLFGAIMGLSLLLGCAASIAASTRDGWLRSRRWLVACALLLAQGALAIQRLDALVAVCLAGALLAAARRWPARLGVAVGAAASLKFLPLLLAAPLLAADPALRTRRSLARAGAALAATLAVGIGANFVFSRDALRDVLAFHAERGLQIESSFAVLQGVAARLAGGKAEVVHAFGGMNLGGPLADAVARASGPLMVIAVLAAAALAYRTPEHGADVRDAAGGASARNAAHPGDSERVDALAMALLLGIAAMWLTAKVFSPQYLTWAIPIPLALSSPRLRTTAFALVAIMAVTQLYMRGYYSEVVEQSAIGLGTLAARLAMLIALAVHLARSLRELTASRRLAPR